jgi:hypothetical protein
VSRRARRRRPRPEPEPAWSTVHAENVTAADQLDPRAFLVAPVELVNEPDLLLAWARVHATDLLLADGEAVRAAGNRTRLSAMTPEDARRLRREHRRSPTP